MEAKGKYLSHLSEKLGVSEDKIFNSLVQSEYAYGVTATIVAIVVFWIAVWTARICYRKAKEEPYAMWDMATIGCVALILAMIATAGNGVHHIMSPESYAIEKVYQIVEEDYWEIAD